MKITNIKFQNLDFPSNIWETTPAFDWDRVKVEMDVELLAGLDVSTMCEDIPYEEGLKKIINLEYDYEVINCSQYIIKEKNIVRIIIEAKKRD